MQEPVTEAIIAEGLREVEHVGAGSPRLYWGVMTLGQGGRGEPAPTLVTLPSWSRESR